jgi:hypothetical protein
MAVHYALDFFPRLLLENARQSSHQNRKANAPESTPLEMTPEAYKSTVRMSLYDIRNWLEEH